MWYVDKKLSNWYFMTYNNVEQEKKSLAFYSLLFFANYENIYSEFLPFHNTYSNFFFNEYDVTTLKIIHPITFRIIQSNQLKCCEIEITSCKHATFLYNGSAHSIWTFLYGMYFITSTFLRYKTNVLFLVFNRTKQCPFKKMQLGY